MVNMTLSNVLRRFSIEIDKSLQQTDSCCKKVCDDLNDEITARKESIAKDRLSKPGIHNSSLAVATNIQEYIYALEEFRERLKDERICECATRKKVQGKEQTIHIQKEMKSERKRAPTIMSAGVARLHKRNEPVLSYSFEKGCCIGICKVLNGQIKFIDNILDASVMVRAGTDIEPIETEATKKEEMGRRFMAREEMEKKAINKAESEMLRNEQFISLAHQSYALKQYRTYIKKSNICECEL